MQQRSLLRVHVLTDRQKPEALAFAAQKLLNGEGVSVGESTCMAWRDELAVLFCRCSVAILAGYAVEHALS